MVRKKAARAAKRAALALGIGLEIAIAPATARADFPTLERVLELARTRSLPVTEASGQLGVANATMVGARASSLGNPFLQVTTEYGGPGLSGSPRKEQVVSAQLAIPLDINGQRGARIDEADSLIRWRKLGLVSARAQITGDAISAYGDVIIDSARVALAIRGEEDARKESQYFAGRLAAGDTTLYERSLADAEVARWVQIRAEGELRLALSVSRLSQSVGFPVETPNVEATPPPALRGRWDEEHIGKIVEASAGIVALRSEQQYWTMSIERAERDKWAPLTFVVTGGRGDAGEARIGAGLGWSFPFTRRNQGEIARAELERARASSLEQVYKRVLDARIRASVAALRSIRDAVAWLDSVGIPAAEKVVEASNEGFRLGKVELSRVLLARRDLSTARSRRLDLLEAAWDAYGNLAAVNGELP